MRFIHTADLQIGKAFGQFPADVASVLRSARLETLRRIAQLAEERSVDAVLVAGDCFDDVAVSDETLRRFKVALESFGGQWILLPGNHDPAIAESPWSRLRRLGLPKNITIADEPKPIEVADKAVILPAPLRRRRDAADQTAWFDQADASDRLVRIGLAHGSVREFLPQASEAANPVALDRAETARLDYLALGDWHGCLQVSQRAWYAGTPEPDRFRTNEPGFVLDVTIDGREALPKVERVPLAKHQWIDRSVEVAPGGSEELKRGLGPSDGELSTSILRLRVQGTVDLATRAEIEEALADLRARTLHVIVEDNDVVVEPSDDDLDSIDTAGFVRAAMERLREMEQGAEAAVARRALGLLYGLHHHGDQ